MGEGGRRVDDHRPRHPERTALYRVVHGHLDRYLGTCEERFEPRWGLLRSVVVRTAEAFLEYGRLRNGFNALLLTLQQFLNGEPDVTCNLTK